jgi:hypothetical protein
VNPKHTKTVKRFVWVIATLVGMFVLYTLSLGPVLRFFDTAHAPQGYRSLPFAVRFFYYPLQHIPWPRVYSRYLVTVSQPTRVPYVPTEAEHAAWPKTVEEAVTRILTDMSDADKKGVRDTKKQDLILFHHDWGMGIRNDFGLWRSNTNLIVDCHAAHPDDASMVIIEAVWRKLQTQ